MSAVPVEAGEDPDFINFPLEREALQFFPCSNSFFYSRPSGHWVATKAGAESLWHIGPFSGFCYQMCLCPLDHPVG